MAKEQIALRLDSKQNEIIQKFMIENKTENYSEAIRMIINLHDFFKKQIKDFENILTLTGSIDTKTIINLEERLKLLESKLNKDQL